MKDVFIGLILTLVLIAFFSSIYTPFEPIVWGSGDKKPGDSDMVLPGKGAKPAESMSESPQNKTAENRRALCRFYNYCVGLTFLR